ncbi:MAG TPA: sulfotransferase [Phycisphaerae bacterium]|nr:sulfotransferase [Phycisphaerae bacterium]
MQAAVAARIAFATAMSRMPDSRRAPPRAYRNSALQAAQMVDVLSARIRAARQAWTAGHRAEAIQLFDQAVRLEPNNVQAYIVAARSYAERFEFDRMEHTLEQLVRRAPLHPGVHHYVGETYGMLKLPKRALASYERAVRLPGGGPPTWMELASLYERAHRLDEAEELIERTLRAGFDLPLVALVRGRIQRRQERIELAEATFRSLLARLPAESEWACQAWGEIALLKDQQGDADGAVDAIGQCKRMQRSRQQSHWAASEKLQSFMREMISTVKRDDFRRWRDQGSGFAPQRVALLSGFPRSGTTLLEQVLDSHPDLVSSEERDFVGNELLRTFTSARGNTPFLDVLNQLRPSQIEPQRRRYRRFMEYLLDQRIAARMLLDKNPAYNLTIPLMLRVFPETRIIIALRDPRDVVLSCYLRYLPLNTVSVRFLDVQSTAERYALDLSAWLKFRELIDVPWCEVRYEDVVADLPREARRALDTLGLTWDEGVLNYRQQLADQKQVTSPSYAAVAQPIYTQAMGRWKNYARILEPAMETLQPFIQQFGYDR